MQLWPLAESTFSPVKLPVNFSETYGEIFSVSSQNHLGTLKSRDHSWLNRPVMGVDAYNYSTSHLCS